MTGDGSRGKQVRAVLFAAIMVVSMVAAGVGGFAGSAAAEVSSIDGVTAENVTAGSASQTQNVTLVGVNRTDSNLSDIDVELFADNTSVEGASVSDAGSFGDTNVSAGDRPDGGFFVEIDGNQTVTDDITIEVTLNTSNADPQLGDYTASSANGASAEGSFDILSDGPITVDADEGTDDGSSPYATIQAAIDNAESGDTIEVRSGNYDEQIVINRGNDASNLTIRAADGASPTINYSANDGTPTVAVDQDDITLEGFTISRSNSDSRVAQAVRVTGDDVQLIDNTYQPSGGSNDAAVAVLTDSSGTAGNPAVSGVTINDVTISGGEVITNQPSQTGVLVVDDGAASFGGAGSVSVSDVTFTANADSTQVYELDTGGGVINIADTLNDNEFDRAAAASETATDASINGFSIEGIISTSIQDAVDRADSGSTVAVASGTYEESVTISTEGLTLEGPNAGLAGDSSQRGTEATITDANGRSEINAPNVTIDGLNFEFGGQAIRSGGGVDGLITNSRFELTDDTSDGYAIRAEESSSGIDVTDNLFTGITSNDGTDGDNANGVVVRDPDRTRIAGNNFSSVDTAVNIGSKSNDTASGTVVVEKNNFSGITQFGAVLVNNPDTSLDVNVNNNTINSSEVGIFTFNADDQATFSIQDNEFQNFADDKVFVNDAAGVLTLSDVVSDNAFDPSALAASANDEIIPATTVDVVNVDQQTGFDQIQSAVDAANSGDTIEIEAGTYNEEVTIDKPLTLIGAGNSANGTVLNTSSSGSGNGITVDASNLTVRNLRITDYSDGIRMTNTHSNIVFENVDSVGNSNRGMELRNSADLTDLTLNNVDFSNNNRGIRGATTSSVDGLTITDSEFSNNVEGIYIAQSESSPGQLNDVTISNTEFIDNDQKGIYTEKLSNATLNDITVDGITSNTYVVNNGLDINLKYDDYENITIRDSTVASVSEGDPLNGNPSASVAVTIKARGSSPDDTSYTSTPAALDDVTIENVVIEDSFNGLQIGEFGKDYSGGGGPTNVEITDSTFQNNSGYHVEDVTDNLDLDDILSNQLNNDFDRVVTIEDDAGNITGDSIFGAIQPAVNAASDGSIVSVGPGTYNESVTINTQNVTLEGPNAGTSGYSDNRDQEAIINRIDTPTSGGAAVSITADEVTVDGFQIESSAQDGINIGEVSNDTTITNTRITRVDGNTFGSDNGAGNGINIQTGGTGGDSLTGLTFTDNEISGISSPGADGNQRANAIQFAGENDDILIKNVDISDNLITDIEPDSGEAGADARGITVDTPGSGGDVENVDITDNTFRDFVSADSRAILLFETSATNPRQGPSNFTITGNTITDLTSGGEDPPVALFVGGYEDLGEQHQFSRNNIENGVVSRVLYDQSGFDTSAADTLDASDNWWGNEDGPRASNSSGTDGLIATQPFLTSQVENLEDTDDGTPRQFAAEVRLSGTTTLAFPAPSERTLDETVNKDKIDTFYVYDNSDQQWEVPGDGDDGTFDSSMEPDALDVFVIVVEDGKEATAVVEFENRFVANQTQLGETDVSDGWNLVSPSQAGNDTDTAFATQDVSIELTSEAPFQDPTIQPFEAYKYDYSPYRGYWTYFDEDANGDGKVASATFDGLTLQEYRESVNLDN